MTHPVPLVSVCVPAFNRGELLRACLWSILRQTFSDFELIVVDNASSEDLRGIALGFNDPRVKYFRNEKNLGANRNFQRAAELASGKYIKFVCSDDMLLPDCLREAVTELESYPDAGALVFKSAKFSESGLAAGWRYSLPWQGLAKNLDVSEHRRVFKFVNAAPTEVLFNRKAFWELGGFNPEYSAIPDWELYARMLQKSGGVVFLERVLALYRVHTENDSLNAGATLRFLEDSLKLSRCQPEGALIDVWGNIWLQFSQYLRAGRNIWPVAALVHKYNYLGGFVLRLPLMAGQRLWGRFRKSESQINLGPVPPQDEGLEPALLSTLADSRAIVGNSGAADA